MAAVQAHLRYEGAGSGWLAVGAAMLALAIGGGYAVATGEVAGLFVGLSLVGAVAVLFDFRIGAVLLLLMLPLSASALFPRGLMGINGLNPLNLLVMATLASYLVHGRARPGGALVPQPVMWLYVVPIVLAGLIGMRHVNAIPSFFYDAEVISFYTERQYLLLTVVKPMVMVGIALLIGAAAARSQKPERFIVPIAVSACLVALIQIGFVVLKAPSLAVLASAQERGFYEPLGMHANSFGRLHLFSLALLLFVWAETKTPALRRLVVVTLGVVAFALLLSFSRAAIGAAVVVGALFLTWKFNARRLAFVLLGLLLVGIVAADVIYARMTHGFGEGADAVSAGRIDGIWLPLLPEVAKSPIWGHGVSSILWSFPMVNDAMNRVGHPHSAYLEALLDMGIIGLALLLAYYAHVWKGFRTLGSNAWLSPELRGLFEGATAALIAFLLTGLVGSSLRPEPESAYLWIAIGLMYGVRGRKPAS
ncbi:MAG TPA: O-antigen ligase family protein [Burkholderiales bacterium]